MTPSDPASPPTGPLSGIIVVDLTRVLAGPYCSMVLADLGATVIKVEQPAGGDDRRAFGPFVGEECAYFASLNRGKQSIALDLKSEADRAIFEKLLTTADVLIENFRPGAMDRLGYGWAALSERYPGLIYAAVSGFGQDGPYARRPAYDLIVQAMGGIMSVTGWPDTPPARVGTSIGDIAAGLFTAIGIAAALFSRREVGKGMQVDVGMLDCQVAILENALARYAASGEIPGPLGARHPSITPFEMFRASDGYIVIAAGNDGIFKTLCRVLGDDDLAADPRFSTNALRTLNQPALHEAIQRMVAPLPVARWTATLIDAGIPAAAINSIHDIVADPHIGHRNMIVQTTLAGGSPLKVAGNPIKFSAFPDPKIRPKVPALDGDRQEILSLVTDHAPDMPARSEPLGRRLSQWIGLAVQRGRRLLGRARETGAIGAMTDLATTLLSARGEVSGAALSARLIDIYADAGKEDRTRFFLVLAERFGPSRATILDAAARYERTGTDDDLLALAAAVEPPRQELFRRINTAPGGTAALVGMRKDLLDGLRNEPGLRVVDADLRHLLASWFNRGFLRVERIDWRTPAAVLEKLISYEAVHEIRNWNDLRRRLADDRRCYAFFHPSLPEEPLVFVEVALVKGLAHAIRDLIDAPPPAGPATKADTAVFYSISNCQKGLRQISFGNLLLKQVIGDLAAELPGVKTFATLSPIPKFRAWLEDLLDRGAFALPPRAEQALRRLAPDADPLATFRTYLNDDAVLGLTPRPDCIEPALLSACAAFLAATEAGPGTGDPVARFHLANGAVIRRLNWLGNPGPRGLRESFGIMVNYLYDPDEIERNHERFVQDGAVALAADVERLLKR